MSDGGAEVVVQVRSEAEPEIEYVSGATISRERLTQGRFVGQFRSATGQPIGAKVAGEAPDRMVGTLPVEAFQLEIDGFQLNSHWRWLGHEELSPSADHPHARHVVQELEHELRPVRVKIHTRLDGSPFIARWLEITNTGAQPSALSSVAPYAGLLWFVPQWRARVEKPPFTVGWYRQTDKGHEGDFVWESLPAGTTTLEGRLGHSGWGVPFFIARNEVSGEAVLAHLAWSGNWSIELMVDTERAGDVDSRRTEAFRREGLPPDAALFFKISPTATAPQRIIAPGETVETPVVHLGHMHGGLTQCVHALHHYLRDSVLRRQVPGRELLIGAGRIVEEDQTWLRHEIDLAAETGCEYFVIDAGWYGAKPQSWYTTVGDWNVGEWLPDGLEGLRRYIQDKGMFYGLWMEPESVGSDSRLLKERPDWVLQSDGQPVGNGRSLDLSNPEVAAWLEEEVIRVFREHEMQIFKLDYNTHPLEGGQRLYPDAIENSLWRHVEVIYRVFQRVQDEFPDVVLENCASGGARNDIGILSRFHIACQSDWSSAPRSLKALNNLTIAIPPDRFRYYVGHVGDPARSNGDLHFQLRQSLFSNPIFVGFGRSGEDLSEDLIETYRHYIELYKRFLRPILLECKVFHHTPALPLDEPVPWCVLEYASPDRSRSYAGLFRLPGTGEPTYGFAPRGLDRARRYRVAYDGDGTSIELSGLELMQNGLAIRLENAMSSELLLFEAVESVDSGQ